jgi:hypothetical protein
MTVPRVSVLLASVFALGAAPQTDTMPPLSQYMMSPQAEIALARSAAPAEISKHATIVVLGEHGYTVAVKGQNGFTCIVERGWTQPFGAPDFWDVKVRSPICYNGPAARTVLAYTYKRTDLALAGSSKSQIHERIVAAIAAKSLPLPKPSSMAYMLSKSQYINNGVKGWYPHVMVFTPMDDSANSGVSWGADRKFSPVLFDSQDKMPEPWSCFFIPVGHWSDGTAAPVYPAS